MSHEKQESETVRVQSAFGTANGRIVRNRSRNCLSIGRRGQNNNRGKKYGQNHCTAEEVPKLLDIVEEHQLGSNMLAVVFKNMRNGPLRTGISNETWTLLSRNFTVWTIQTRK